jgi:glycerophosphoryl diester phosphodiesterase
MTLKRIAHRGASGQAPENTIAAFERAVELNVDLLEMDVRVCRSGEAVIIHDAAVDRTTDGSGEVNAMDWEQLRMLDAGEGERISLFSEILDRFAPRCGLLIELKELEAAGPVISALLDQELWSREDIIVQSFDEGTLSWCGHIGPDIRRHLLLGSDPDEGWLEAAERCGALSVNPHHSLVTPDFVSQCREHGHDVIAWTVDELEDIERVKSAGVDGIISNYPDRL